MRNPLPPHAPEANAIAAIAAHDIGVALGLAPLALMSWLVPEIGWPGLARAIAPAQAHALFGSPAEATRRVRAVLGEHAGAIDIEAMLRRLAANDLIAMLQFLRDYRPGGWYPAVDVDGARHLDAALEAGTGGVLWVGHFAFASTLAKLGLARAGYAVNHLSHPRHGFSATRFGMRWLNPVRTRIEDRYLAERVQVSLASPVAALRRLRKLVGAGGLVSFNARGGAAPLRLPLFAGQFELAPGAPDLAIVTGAPLLPVLAVGAGDGRYLVRIGAPLPIPTDGERRARVHQAGLAYARWTETQILAYPDQWLGWAHI